MKTEIDFTYKPLANSARGFIKALKETRITIAAVLADWNLCVAQCHLTGKYDFPTEGYTRKAQVIADLERCAQQLDDLSAGVNRVVDVNEAHDAALLAEMGIYAMRRVMAFPETVISTDEAHAEALEMNTTHDNKVIDMNKARQKQQQTAANLPKAQMVDVIRAFLRTTPASQEQIDSVAKLSESELARLIRKFDEKGARITAHLTKSKSAGYGFLTFGYNGQLPPGTYHKMIVTNMKNAREVASRYGAMMWNF